jgi:hypothetical protein
MLNICQKVFNANQCFSMSPLAFRKVKLNAKAFRGFFLEQILFRKNKFSNEFFMKIPLGGVKVYQEYVDG